MRKVILATLMALLPMSVLASKASTDKDIYLHKIQGEESFSYAKSVFLKCKLGPKQLKSIAKLEELAQAALKEKEVSAMHLMQQVPSIEYKMIYHGKEVILKKDSASLVYRDGKASKALVKVLDDMCQWK